MSRRDACSIVKSKVLENEIRNAKRIEVLPNGVDVRHFTILDKEESRKKIGLTTANEKVILFPSDPGIPTKNYTLLANVLKRLETNNIRVIAFHGNKIMREEVPYYFNAADLVVFTSFAEGSPNVIKEAMACNCHIYSTDCGDVRWSLEGVNGSRVLSYDTLEWEQAIIDFFKPPNRVVPNSRDILLEKKLDADSIAKRIVDIYCSLLQTS